MMFLLLGLVVAFFVLVFSRKREQALIAFINGIGVFLLLSAGMYIDAPTILYMTDHSPPSDILL